jgi:hypothetical protein
MNTKIKIVTTSQNVSEEIVALLKRFIGLNPNEEKLFKELFLNFEKNEILFLGKNTRIELQRILDLQRNVFNNTLSFLHQKSILERTSPKHYRLNSDLFVNKQELKFPTHNVEFIIL